MGKQRGVETAREGETEGGQKGRRRFPHGRLPALHLHPPARRRTGERLRVCHGVAGRCPPQPLSLSQSPPAGGHSAPILDASALISSIPLICLYIGSLK